MPAVMGLGLGGAPRRAGVGIAHAGVGPARVADAQRGAGQRRRRGQPRDDRRGAAAPALPRGAPGSFDDDM